MYSEGNPKNCGFNPGGCISVGSIADLTPMIVLVPRELTMYEVLEIANGLRPIDELLPMYLRCRGLKKGCCFDD